MAEDFSRKHEHATPDQLRAMVAIDIECRLREKNFSLQDFGIQLIAPTEQVRREVQLLDEAIQVATLPLVRREHLAYDVAQLREQYEQKYPLLRPAQKQFVDEVLQANGTAFFLDAVGGAGKTFCENLLLSKLRSENKIAIDSSCHEWHCSNIASWWEDCTRPPQASNPVLRWLLLEGRGAKCSGTTIP